MFASRCYRYELRTSHLVARSHYYIPILYGGVFFMSKINIHSTNLAVSLQELKKPKQLSLCGLLLALYLVTYSLNIPISLMVQIRLGFLVLAMAGFAGGPVMGLTVGIVGDLLSMFLLSGKSGGSYFFGFTLSYALLGLFFGLLFYRKSITIPRVIIAGLIEFLTSLILNTLWLSILYGTTYQAQFLLRLPKCLIMLVVNTILLYILMKSLAVSLRRAKLVL